MAHLLHIPNNLLIKEGVVMQNRIISIIILTCSVTVFSQIIPYPHILSVRQVLESPESFLSMPIKVRGIIKPTDYVCTEYYFGTRCTKAPLLTENILSNSTGPELLVLSPTGWNQSTINGHRFPLFKILDTNIICGILRSTQNTDSLDSLDTESLYLEYISIDPQPLDPQDNYMPLDETTSWVLNGQRSTYSNPCGIMNVDCSTSTDTQSLNRHYSVLGTRTFIDTIVDNFFHTTILHVDTLEYHKVHFGDSVFWMHSQNNVLRLRSGRYYDSLLVFNLPDPGLLSALKPVHYLNNYSGYDEVVDTLITIRNTSSSTDSVFQALKFNLGIVSAHFCNVGESYAFAKGAGLIRYDYYSNCRMPDWSGTQITHIEDLAYVKNPAMIWPSPVSISKYSNGKANQSPLYRISPNPFSKTISFVPEKSVAASPLKYSVSIFDCTGRKVNSLQRTPANQPSAWDGRDNKGMQVSPGVYFVRIESGNGALKQTAVVVKR
jgi:hypothetical protein